MGGLIVLPVTGLLGFSYATWRQGAPTTILWWAAGVVIGLLPVTAFLARRTSHFWLEFLLPVATGLLVALTVRPLCVRWSRARPHGPTNNARAT
jgi:zinc transporter ZupT